MRNIEFLVDYLDLNVGGMVVLSSNIDVFLFRVSVVWWFGVYVLIIFRSLE